MSKGWIIKATFNRSELMDYLGIGEIKINKLLLSESFPKQKPILRKWSRVEIDNWLNSNNKANTSLKSRDDELSWGDFFNN